MGCDGDDQRGDGLRVCDLGAMDYGEALALQRDVNTAVAAGDEPDTLLLVEHPAVITITPRRGAAEHLIAGPDRLHELGIVVAPTDRGGDITYHGPGQLVAYPILRLNPHGLNLGRYMRLLEAIVIDTLGRFGVEGHREQGATGVWVGAAGGWPLAAGPTEDGGLPAWKSQPPAASRQQPAKICAMGVRVRKNTTMHGLALNVTTDLSHFQTIVPCGLAGRPVTSLRELLGERCPAMGEVKRELVRRFEAELRSSTGAPA